MISSPNVNVIPEPWLGHREVYWGADGKFNGYDPARWPQCFASKDIYRWVMAVRSPPPENAPEFAMWRPLSNSDVTWVDSTGRLCVVIEPICVSMKPSVDMLLAQCRAFAEVMGDRVSLLNKICKHVESIFPLLSHPHTPRDQVRMVADVQRNWAFADAWLEWHAYIYPPSKVQFKDPDTTRRRNSGVRTDLLGGFTEDTSFAAELFNRNIPVWLIRDPDAMTAQSVVLAFLSPEQFQLAPRFDSGIMPQEPVYVGAQCEQRIDAIVRAGMTALDGTAGIARLQSQPVGSIAVPSALTPAESSSRAPPHWQMAKCMSCTSFRPCDHPDRCLGRSFEAASDHASARRVYGTKLQLATA